VDLSTLDLNALPAWIVAVAVVLFLLPGILKGLAPFVPPLSRQVEAHARRVEAEETREDVTLHHRLETNGLRLGQELKAQERLIDILEQSLERMWDDRVASEANYELVVKELRELRYQIQGMGSTLSLHGQQVARLTDEQAHFSDRLGQMPERVDSLGAYVMSDG
jgi:chromosome segregation ATPase